MIKDNALSYLENSLSNGTMAHAYVLLGPANAEQMETLEVFLPVLLNNNHTQNHPDIKIVEPENEVIKIETIRELRDWLAKSPLASKQKIAIIKDSGKMNIESQNAFLKVLEEPIANTFIFLLAGHKHQLLPTIFSRTVALYFTAKSLTTKDDILLKEILSIQSPSERMRYWTQNKPSADQIKPWLNDILPNLRAILLTCQTKNLTKIIRDLLASLSGPKGQNWQLIAENLIISL